MNTNRLDVSLSCAVMERMMLVLSNTLMLVSLQSHCPPFDIFFHFSKLSRQCMALKFRKRSKMSASETQLSKYGENLAYS